MPDDDGDIGGRPASNECPDCGCRAHFREECVRCGCPSGIDRKKARDATHIGSHSDASRPSDGFY